MIQVPILYKNTHPPEGKIRGTLTITDVDMIGYIKDRLKILSNAKDVEIYCASIDAELNITFSFKSFH